MTDRRLLECIMLAMSACIVCGGTRWCSLPNPCPDRSMLSDLRVLHSPLDKEACAICGLVRRFDHVTSKLFDSGYQLYDHPPGATRENARQEAYAEWLSSQVATAPRSILDLGCGNGSLLLAFGRRWPDAQLHGLDPSQESVGRARDAGIDARWGSVGVARLDPADLVVTVNVIEHVEDPPSFVRSVAALVTPGGTALVACPDGRRAWLELLFADHLWSFIPAHLSRLAGEAGLEVVDGTAAPPALGSFQLMRLRHATTPPQRVTMEPEATAELTGAKQSYLHAWGLLDQELLERSRHTPSLVCFGMGEAAALLRAYAPALWSRVKLCAADRPEGDVFGDIPVVDYTGGRFEWPVILGVRPAAQAGLARRLQDNGCSVIRWDDCIAA
jgi:SAM-dependent methyltransferase